MSIVPAQHNRLRVGSKRSHFALNSNVRPQGAVHKLRHAIFGQF